MPKTMITEADRDEIFRRAELGQTGGRIARAIGQHPATVNWFMYSNGLKRRSGHKLRAPFTRRDGIVVHSWRPEDDATMERLATEGRRPAQIAVVLSEILGRVVKAHSVKVRLVMLASFAETADTGVQPNLVSRAVPPEAAHG